MSQWLENNENTLTSVANQSFKGFVENEIEAKAESLRKQAIQEQMLLFLDEFQVNGVIASWWNEIQYDLKTVAAQNFDGLIEGWVETIRADLDSDNKNVGAYCNTPLQHKLVVRLLPKYLQQLADYEAKKADLESQLAATKKSDEESEEGELEDEEQLSEAEIKKLKQELLQVKKILTKFKEDLIKQLDNARKQLMMEQCQRLVLDIAKDDLENQLNRIAEILDTIDEAIAQTSSIIAKLKQIKAGLLHDLLTRGLDENGELRDAGHPEQFKDSPLGRIPKDWEIGKLRDFYSIPARNGLYKPAKFYGKGVLMIHICLRCLGV
ncbi:MAG: hypothetical protein WCO29_18165 [Nostocales cyanobacterium ELA583]